MSAKEHIKCRVLVPAAVLGAGFSEDSLEYGASLGPHAIALDAGSTDSGPYYLGTGTSKMNRDAIKADLRPLLMLRHRLNIPLLIGSCGTCGTDSGVDWVHHIMRELFEELSVAATVALLYSEQTKSVIKKKISANSVVPLPPSAAINERTVDECEHIVALLGAEPYIQALDSGAQIVLGGRTTDTAVLAAVPLRMGLPAGPSWHAAKTAECGAVCTTEPTSGGVIFTIDPNGFEIEPLGKGVRCTPQTVAAHMLYENANPFRMKEPRGVLDNEPAIYHAVDERVVRVEGSRFIEDPQYTMKLEGAGRIGYQTIILQGVQDPTVLNNLDAWQENLLTYLQGKIDSVMKLPQDDYHLSIRLYGWNAVSGRSVADDSVPPREVGVLFAVTAAEQQLATSIVKLCNPYFLHFPLTSDQALPSYAYPFSPAEIERGPIYEFKLNHVVKTDNPMELVRVRIDATTAEKAQSDAN